MSREPTELGILELLARSGPLYLVDLTERVDHHPVAVDQACSRLHEAGYISPSSYGMYDVTPRGEQRLDESTDHLH